MRSYKNYTKKAEERTQTGTAEALAMKLAAAYNGKSNASMFKSILEEAEKSKRAGTLSNEEIESFYQSFAPMLNSSQRRQLKEVVDRLKRI